MFPITRVLIYKNGVAYFEREGKVTGDQNVELNFKPSDMNDILRSLRVVDDNGGNITNISYETTKELRTAGRLPIFIPNNGSMAAILNHLQGVNITIEHNEESITGRVLGLSTKQPLIEKANPTQALDMMIVNKLVSFSIPEITAITIQDERISGDLSAFLDHILSTKDLDTRKVTIQCAGKGARVLHISYLLENPVWKSNYRLYMNKTNSIVDDNNYKNNNNNNNNDNNNDTNTNSVKKSEFEFLLEGWACVDNVTESDWENISLTLVSGTPISFSFDLYNPIVGIRPAQFITQGQPQKFEQKMTNTFGNVNAQQQQQLQQQQLQQQQLQQQQQQQQLGLANVIGPAPSFGAQPFGAQPLGAPTGAFGFGATPTSGFAFSSSAPALTSTSVGVANTVEVGNLFHYEIQNKISVHSNHSSLVPTVSGVFNGRKICWFDAQTHLKPLQSVLFKNTLGTILDSGPVIVTENNKYVGESLLESLVSQMDTKIIPYSVHLGCLISKSGHEQINIPLKLEIRKGVLTVTQIQQDTVTYYIQNKTDEEVEFALDHTSPFGSKMEKTEADKEVKIREGVTRLFFSVHAHNNKKFVVIHKRSRQTANVRLLLMSGLLMASIENLLTPEVGNALFDIFDSAKNIFALRTDYQSLKHEESVVLVDQQRLQNILYNAYADEHMRTTFSLKLTTLEDSLTGIRACYNALYAEWSSKRSSLLDDIESVEFSVSLEGQTAGSLEKFKLPAMFHNATIQELLAEPEGAATTHGTNFKNAHDNYRTKANTQGTSSTFGGTGTTTTTTASPFGTQASLFNFSPTPATGGSTTLGSTPASFGSPAGSTSGFGSTPAGSTSSFGSTPAGSTSGFGSSSSATFGFGSTPAGSTSFGFGSPSSATGSTSFGFGSPSSVTGPTLGFGSPYPATGSASGFGSFSASTTPAFGASTTPAFGASTAPAFGASTAPAFGASTGTTFGESTTPAVGTTPAFGANPFAATATFGATTTTTFAPASFLFGSPSIPTAPVTGTAPSLFGQTANTGGGISFPGNNSTSNN